MKDFSIAVARMLARRLREPSSWAGIAAFVAATTGIVAPDAVVQYISMIGMGAAGLVAFVLPE